MAVTSYPTRIDAVSTDIEKVGGKNATVGMAREDHEGRKYVLLKSGGNILTGIMLGFGFASGLVTKSAGNTVPHFGVNTTGKSLAANDYFWCQVYGQATTATDGSVVDMKLVASDANGNSAISGAAGINEYVIGFAIGDDVGTVGNVFISPMGCYKAA